MVKTGFFFLKLMCQFVRMRPELLDYGTDVNVEVFTFGVYGTTNNAMVLLKLLAWSY